MDWIQKIHDKREKALEIAENVTTATWNQQKFDFSNILIELTQITSTFQSECVSKKYHHSLNALKSLENRLKEYEETIHSLINQQAQIEMNDSKQKSTDLKKGSSTRRNPPSPLNLGLDLNRYNGIGIQLRPTEKKPCGSRGSIRDSSSQKSLSIRGTWSKSRTLSKRKSVVSVKDLSLVQIQISEMKDPKGSIKVPAAAVPPPPLQSLFPPLSMARNTTVPPPPPPPPILSSSKIPPPPPPPPMKIADSKNSLKERNPVKGTETNLEVSCLPEPKEQSSAPPIAPMESLQHQLKRKFKSLGIAAQFSAASLSTTHDPSKSNQIHVPSPKDAQIAKTLPEAVFTSSAPLANSSIPPPPPPPPLVNAIPSKPLEEKKPCQSTRASIAIVQTPTKSLQDQIAGAASKRTTQNDVLPSAIVSTESKWNGNESTHDQIPLEKRQPLLFQEELLSKKLSPVKAVPLEKPSILPCPDSFESQLKERIRQRALALEKQETKEETTGAPMSQTTFPSEKLSTEPDPERESLNQPILEVTPEMIAKSIQTFNPKGPGQIGFDKEESLIIIQWNYADGWAHVASVDGKRVGIFPQALIQRLVP